MKRCSKCGERLPRSEFYKRSAVADGLEAQCKACRDAYDKLYRNGHKAEKAARDKLYYSEHKEKTAARVKLYRNEHKAERAAYNKLYRAEHREERREKDTATMRAWRARHPLKVAATRRRRRARKNGAEGQHTAEEFEALRASAAWQCLRCGMPHGERPLTADHIVPLSRGGTDSIENIQPLCKNCNSRKGVQTIDYRQDPWWACCT